MPLIAGTCKNCGATIKFDDSLEKGVCEYCGTPFLKQDIIVNNHYHNKFENATVILNDTSSIENKLENAETYLTKLNDYDKAKEIFLFVTENKAADYRGWWGMVRVLSRQFTMIECTQSDYEHILKYYNNAIAVASDEQKEILKAEWTPYSQKVKSYIKQKTLEKNERQQQFEKTQKRKNTRKLIRSTISIVLSLVCNIAVIAGIFSVDIEKYATTWGALITIIFVVLGANTIITTVLGLIGSTKICTALPAVSAVVFLGVTIFKMFESVNFDIFALIFLALIILAAIIVTGICFVIPMTVLNRFVK